ncbi:tyrosine-protein kinase SYK [Pelomyxa schiedti]|nr:tyrosine-protein kinase SYK [Pelomyxa schiedti]
MMGGTLSWAWGAGESPSPSTTLPNGTAAPTMESTAESTATTPAPAAASTPDTSSGGARERQHCGSASTDTQRYMFGGYEYNLPRNCPRVSYDQLADETIVTMSKNGPIKSVVYNGERLVLKPDLADAYILCTLAPHPRVVKFHGIVERQGILLSYFPLGSLESLVSRNTILSAKEIARLAWDVALAMEHLHSQRIVYRDLALRNILLSQEEDTGHEFRATITDFGWSLRLEENETQIVQQIVSAPWKILSPEAVNEFIFTFSGDVWSFGIFLYSLLSHTRPFDGKSISETRTLLSQGYHPDIDTQQTTSHAPHPGLVSLMRECLQHQASLRPSFHSLVPKLSSLYYTL